VSVCDTGLGLSVLDMVKAMGEASQKEIPYVSSAFCFLSLCFFCLFFVCVRTHVGMPYVSFDMEKNEKNVSFAIVSL
jgi:hypothetical protein